VGHHGVEIGDELGGRRRELGPVRCQPGRHEGPNLDGESGRDHDGRRPDQEPGHLENGSRAPIRTDGEKPGTGVVGGIASKEPAPLGMVLSPSLSLSPPIGG
jgi:hypothetical protein